MCMNLRQADNKVEFSCKNKHYTLVEKDNQGLDENKI